MNRAIEEDIMMFTADVETLAHSVPDAMKMLKLVDEDHWWVMERYVVALGKLANLQVEKIEGLRLEIERLQKYVPAVDAEVDIKAVVTEALEYM